MTVQARILLVEDDETAMYNYVRYFSHNGYFTQSVRTLKAAKAVIAESAFDIIILDLKLPDGDSISWIPDLKTNYPNMIVIMITGISDIPSAVLAIKHGAENFLTKPIDMDALKVILEKATQLLSLRKRDYAQKRQLRQTPFFGLNPLTTETLNLAAIAAKSLNVVLLLGETGTGKGVFARYIHEHSSRASEPFVEVNCSSLKGELLKSELFGHAKGAFTSAIKEKEGLLEIADTGTLFLDEIGDMDPEVQTQLLKTIEEKSFRRIGETKVRHSDFRLICATNKDLLAAIPNGFRQDLYYRICVFPIQLHGLNAKKDEIPFLCEHILRSMGYLLFPLDASLVQQLQDYSWPGNVRELRNMLERSIMLAQGARLSVSHFPGLNSESHNPILASSQKLDAIEDIHILQVVAQYSGDMQSASKVLGLSVSSLYRRLSKIRSLAIEATAHS